MSNLKMLERRRVQETMQAIGQAMQAVGQDLANAQRDARVDESENMIALYAAISAQWGYNFLEVMSVLATKAGMPVVGMDDWQKTYAGFHGKDWDQNQHGRFEYLLREYADVVADAEAAVARADVTGIPIPGTEYFARFIQAEHEEGEHDETHEEGL